jgi:hypothetical protein
MYCSVNRVINSSYGFCHAETSGDPKGKGIELCIKWTRNTVFAAYSSYVIFSSRLSSVDCNILQRNGGDLLACLHHLDRVSFLFLVTVWPTDAHTSHWAEFIMHGMGNLNSHFFNLSLLQFCEMHKTCMNTMFIPPKLRTVNDAGLHPNGICQTQSLPLPKSK